MLREKSQFAWANRRQRRVLCILSSLGVPILLLSPRATLRVIIDDPTIPYPYVTAIIELPLFGIGDLLFSVCGWMFTMMFF